MQRRFFTQSVLGLSIAGAWAAVPGLTLAQGSVFAPSQGAVVDEMWTDPGRNRSLPVKIRWPAVPIAVPCPVILFSHGLGGTREGGSLWGQAWAGAGFVVVHMQHPGSDLDAVRRTATSFSDQSGLRASAGPEQFLARIQDTVFVLDEIGRRHASNAPAIALPVDQGSSANQAVEAGPRGAVGVGERIRARRAERRDGALAGMGSSGNANGEGGPDTSPAVGGLPPVSTGAGGRRANPGRAQPILASPIGWAQVRPTQVGMSGHSFGAHTTLGVAGQRYPGYAPVDEARLAAFVAFSPTLPPGNAQNALSLLTRPVLSLTGTRDGDVVGTGATPERRAAIFAALPPGNKAQLVLQDADHMSFGGQSGRAASIIQREQITRDKEAAHQSVIANITTDWWRAHLLGLAAAADRLQTPAGLSAGDSWSVR